MCNIPPSTLIFAGRVGIVLQFIVAPAYGQAVVDAVAELIIPGRLVNRTVRIKIILKGQVSESDHGLGLTVFTSREPKPQGQCKKDADSRPAGFINWCLHFYFVLMVIAMATADSNRHCPQKGYLRQRAVRRK